MRNILFLSVLAFAISFTACKPVEEPLIVSVIEGKVTYEDTETGWEGEAKNAVVKLHKETEEGALKEVVADDNGYYRITDIIMNNTAETKPTYQISAEFKMTIGGSATVFKGRSKNITPAGNDTITCDLHLKI